MPAPGTHDDDAEILNYCRALSAAERNGLFLKAVRGGDTERAALLLKSGATVDCNGGEALAQAAAAGDSPMVALLLRQKADPSAQDSAALFAAIVNNRGAAAELLLAAGADPLANKGTLLGIALSRKFEDVAETLLRHGADPARLYRDMNAYEWAADSGLAGLQEKLRAAETRSAYMSAGYFHGRSLGELRAEDAQGRTGLLLAALAGCFDVVAEKILSVPGETLSAADLLHKDRGGQSALLALGETGRLAQAFDARLWTGRKQEALRLLERSVPDAFRAQVDIAAFSAALDRQALLAHRLKPGLKPVPKLGPKPVP
jgi:hypothetical protein